MISLIHTLNNLLPILYLATYTLYVLNFWQNKKELSLAKRLLLFITILFHFSYLIFRTIEFNHAPITTIFEIFTLLALAITFSYYIIELLTEIRTTGIFILFISVIFQVVSSVFIKDLEEVKEILRSPFLGIHVFSALAGYAGITFSAIYGVLYLLLYKQIKEHRFGLLFNRLPNLEILEKLSVISAIIGLIMLTIAIIIGMIWLPQAFTNPSYFDPKLIATILVWFLYLAGLISKWALKWSGRKTVYFSLAGFVLTLFSISILNILFTGFHKFF